MHNTSVFDVLQGRAVQTAKSLDEGLNVVVRLETTDVAFDNNNGRLVYLQGSLQSKEVRALRERALEDNPQGYWWGMAAKILFLHSKSGMHACYGHHMEERVNSTNVTVPQTNLSVY